MRKVFLAIVLFFGSFCCPVNEASAAAIKWGFKACEIAHTTPPDNCVVIGLGGKAGCADMLGTFDCHHNSACHVPTRDCACNGPKGDSAEIAGLKVPEACQPYGLANGWYHFDAGHLVGPMSRKKCRQESCACFGMCVPNYEQGFVNNCVK